MKKQAPAVQGRSFLFNALFVLLNVAGAVLAVLGAQPYFKEAFFWLNFAGYTLIGVSTAGLFIFQGKLMMANVSRAIVGSLFIVSGLIKANDPVGFAYKLEEYFQDGALAYRIKDLLGDPSFTLEFFANHALFIASLICIVEIVLGVLTLIGLAMKKVAWLLLLLMLFFTFLTWHTATCDPAATYIDHTNYQSDHPQFNTVLKSTTDKKANVKLIERTTDYITVEEVKQVQCVTDCGCFGDAMKGAVGRSLSPWESFWKDCVLVYFVFWILLAHRIIEPNSRKANALYLIATVVITSLLSWIFDWYLLLVFSIVLILSALWFLRSAGKNVANGLGVTLLLSLITILFITYVRLFDPLKDYRPFAIESNLKWKMNDGKEGVYASSFVLKNKQTGEVKTYSEEEYMSRPELWDQQKFQFIKREQIELIPARLPSISDQLNPSIELVEIGKDERDLPGFEEQMLLQTKKEALRLRNRSSREQIEVSIDKYSKKAYPDSLYEMVTRVNIIDQDVKEIKLTNWILEQPLVFVFSSLNLNEADWSNIGKVKAIIAYGKAARIPVIMLTRGSRADINAWKKKYQLSIATFVNDDKGLMMISRSNPNLMLLRKGIVKAKYTRLRLPKGETLKKNLKKS